MKKIVILRGFSLNGRKLKQDEELEVHTRFETKDISMGQAISLVNRKVAKEVKEVEPVVKVKEVKEVKQNIPVKELKELKEVKKS